MTKPWHDTEEFEELVEEVDREDAEFGGPGGSNMAEPPWVPPGELESLDNLPPEEAARRRKFREETRAMIELARKHAEELSAK